MPNVTKPVKAVVQPVEAKVFTREEPCTKVDIHNCFARGGQYVRRPMVEARGDIGLNAIKYLKREALATVFEFTGIDYWELTPAGKQWLQRGLARHLELHPEDESKLESPRVGASPVRRTRTR